MANVEVLDTKTDFLQGEVRIVDFDYYVTNFELVENGAVVEVRNDIHIRLVDNPYRLPETFEIIAPMTAVRIIKGKVPKNYVHKYTLRHYLILRKKFYRE